MLFGLLQEQIGNRPSVVTLGEGLNKKIIPLNQQSMDPQTGQPALINDVSKVKAKIVLDDVPSTPTYRMQQLQMLTEITKSLPPQLQGYVMDFIIEATDMPKRHELADRLRAVVGIHSPEEQQAAAQQQQQLQQHEMQLQTQERQAKIQETMAKAQKLMADAQAAAYANENGGQMAQMQADFERQMRPLYDQISQLQMQLTNRQAEIQAKYESDMAKAQLDASAKVEAERAKAASGEMLRPVIDALTQITHQIELMKQAEDAKAKDLQKQIEEVRKVAETKPEEPKKEEPKEDKAMAQVMATLAQTQAALAQVIATPRETKIIEDENGRAVGAVSKPATKTKE
jgi:hypothetical protein